MYPLIFNILYLIDKSMRLHKDGDNSNKLLQLLSFARVFCLVCHVRKTPMCLNTCLYNIF